VPARQLIRSIVGLATALLVAFHSVPAAFTVVAAACCCVEHRTEGVCHCKVCTHAREVSENHPLLKTCGSSGVAGLVLVQLDPVVPPADEPAVVLLLESPPLGARVRAVPTPPLEVPTPPPVALA
jgi:hypothetical protein